MENIEQFCDTMKSKIAQSYTRMGSKLKNTISGNLPVSDSPSDYHWHGDWIEYDSIFHDDLEQDRISFSEACAFSIGRKTDDLIVQELDKSETINMISYDGFGLTEYKVDLAIHMMDRMKQPNESPNPRYGIVGWRQWGELLQIPSFADADYMDDEELPWMGTQIKKWKEVHWIPCSGLDRFGTTRNCYIYESNGLRHGFNPEILVTATWNEDKREYFINTCMCQEVEINNPQLVVRVPCREE